MLLLLYHGLMSCIVLALLPFFPFIRGKRIRERLGLGLGRRSPFHDTIWVHALSVGEVISAIPLLDAINERYPERDLVFSVTTTQGIALAREKLRDKVKALVPMPVDFWWSIHRVVRYIRPCVFVLVETDIWPGLLSFLQKKRIKCLLINGRISLSTFSAYHKMSFLVRRMFEPFDMCLMQSDLDRDRLSAIGIGREKLKTAGNIKFDHSWTSMDDAERSAWMETLGIRAEHIVIVAGSTHAGEEAMILRAYKKALWEFPMLRLLLAPRRIERAAEICTLTRDGEIAVMLRTRMTPHPGEYQVLVVDTIGELRRLYGLARISFVGGSLVPFGGHNLLEPASFGCPVLFGPHTGNFVQMSEELLRAGGGRRILNEDELEESILRLLREPRLCREMGAQARQFVLKNKGAVGRVMSAIDRVLEGTEDGVGWE
jgi:3-deoxy-D-manno-octulosonic-acid transferase